MKLMQAGLIIFFVGVSMADSPNFIVPTVTILLGMILIIVGGRNAGAF